MIELLRVGGLNNLARSFEQIVGNLDNDASGAANQILGSYGGMGSLNDIVLYAGSRPLAKENNEFDALRSKLYDLCLELRGRGA